MRVPDLVLAAIPDLHSVLAAMSQGQANRATTRPLPFVAVALLPLNTDTSVESLLPESDK